MFFEYVREVVSEVVSGEVAEGCKSTIPEADCCRRDVTRSALLQCIDQERHSR